MTLQIRQVLNTTNKIKNIIRKQHPKVAIGKYIEADGGDIANTASAEYHKQNKKHNSQAAPKVATGKYMGADGGDIANTASAEKLQAATWKVTA